MAQNARGSIYEVNGGRTGIFCGEGEGRKQARSYMVGVGLSWVVLK